MMYIRIQWGCLRGEEGLLPAMKNQARGTCMILWPGEYTLLVSFLYRSSA